MFFAGMGAASDASIARMDQKRRQRVDMANAFETFKRNNPYATVADFQSYIDQMAGGSNYLRGGMPGQDVLEALATDNARRKQRDQFNEKLADVQTRRQTQTTVQDIIDQELLLGTPLAEIGMKVRDMFGEDMGEVFEELDIAGMITPERQDQLVQEKIRGLLPEATTYIGNAISEGNEATAEDLARTFGIPLSIAKPLLDRAKQDHTRQGQDWRRQNYDFLTRKATEAAERGQDVGAVLDSLAKEAGIQLAPDALKEFEEYSTRVVDEKKALAMKEVHRAAQENRAFLSAIRQGSAQDAMDQLKVIIASEPQWVQTYLNQQGALQELYDGLLRAERENQQAEAGTRKTETDLKYLETLQGAREERTQTIYDNFGGEGAAAAMGLDAAVTAGDYALTPAMISAIHDVFASTVGKNGTAAEYQAVAAQLLQGMPQVAGEEGSVRRQLRMNAGYGGVDMTFGAWKDEVKADIAHNRNEFDKQLVEIRSLVQTNPELARDKLRNLKMRLNATVVAVEQEVDWREENAHSDLPWITYGTGRWDKPVVLEEILSPLKSLEAYINTEGTKIDKALGKRKQDIDAAELAARQAREAAERHALPHMRGGNR